MEHAAICIAAGKGCAAGLTYYKRWYAKKLPGYDVEKVASEAWGTQIKQGRVTCK